jgi:hypothetical protein
MKPLTRFLLCMALLGAMPWAASAQTTGRIFGYVTDQGGAPLPGASVEVRSSALPRTRTATTDSSGLYRLTLLPPGRYEVTFSLAGFASDVRPDVTVGLDNETSLDAVLRPEMASLQEQITVISEAPLVDTASTELGSNLPSRLIQALPTGRNYSSVVQVAPGVSSDANPENKSQSTITVYGSSGAENTFLIDGVNTTGVEYGFQGKELNFEFIEEIDVKTGGYEAEYGRSTGAIVNVITKSGGNELHGDVFAYFDSDSLQRGTETVVSTGGTVQGFSRQDFGADLGGYFIKDRLWFFGAYDRVEHTTDSELPGGPLAGSEVESKSSRDLASLKLTLLLGESHYLTGTYFQDPRKDRGAINDANHSLNGEPLTYEGRQDFGGRDFALRYDGVLGSNWILSAQAARHTEKNSVGPESDAGDVVQLRDAEDNFFQRGGFGLIQEKELARNFLGISVSRFLGSHELKFGAEYEQSTADVVKRMSGGQQVDVFRNPEGGRPIYSHFYWTTPTATLSNAPLSQLEASPEHQVITMYLQDRWSVRKNLTLNVGVRWDRQEIIDASGTTQITLDKDFAPRLGLIWDPTSDNRTKVFASYGHYYEQIPMDLVIRSFSYERQPRIFNFDPFSLVPDPLAEAAIGQDSVILGGFTEPSDPDIRNQYIREVVLGFERELVRDFTVGVKGIFRDYRRVVEDFLCGGEGSGFEEGTYCIGNPGEGIMSEIFTLDYAQSFPAPKPKRVYKGVQLDVTKRFSKNWQGIASYVLSELEGNFDGGYAPFTNVGADPNISASWDYYDFFTNGRDLGVITNNGPLSNDRRHQLKASGVYFTPFDLSIGVAAYFKSGTPLTRMGYSDAYGRYEFFLTPRGGEGRNPGIYEADLHLGYPLKTGPVTLNFMLDVFNVLNAQRAILLDQRYSFQEADNFTATAANPGYLQPVLRTPPTSVRLGMRVSF